MKQRIRRIAFWLCLIVAVAAGGFVIKDQYEVRKEQQRAQELSRAAQAKKEEEPSAPKEETPAVYRSPINFDELRRINSETVGWLVIPNTNIDAPMVQTGDNETYLTKAFSGEYSKNGAIYLDYESTGDFTGKNIIIYGHNRKNGLMFQELTKFKDQEFFEANRSFVIYTPTEEIHLRTIACYEGPADAQKRRTKFETEEAFQQYLDEMTAPCAFRQLPAQTKQVFTLITCDYGGNDYRTYLWAVRDDEAQQP